ncbi:hypothetical protein EJB05_23425 [Eragrostis curvula]|uniref:Uncharacterized protein n=1 Tax=Eragrostis curvula TaxID=38414 RepID=A0A5J9V8F6_9POAL|nr:hypothetical protein EJB05_23425 [Eragrostis curvula]
MEVAAEAPVEATSIGASEIYLKLHLVNFVAEHYMWGSKQYISLRRALENHSLDDHPLEIKTDEHLLEWKGKGTGKRKTRNGREASCIFWAVTRHP